MAWAPPDPSAWLVLGHGAGAGMQHANMAGIAAALAAQGVATLRFQFPFTQAGRRRVDPPAVAIASIRAAVAQGLELAQGRPLWLGGHSFGGRMASHAALADDLPVAGLLYCAFPLHPAGKPGTDRAAHLQDIQLPQRFLSGDRDKLASVGLLESVVAGLPDGRLHWLATADHGYRVLKRSRTQGEGLFAELARVAGGWLRTTGGGSR